MLRSYDILVEDPRAVVDGYVKQCSVLVTARDLAVMAATLANRGVNPLTGDRVVAEPVVRQVLSVMATCGMYDAAGDWATQVDTAPAESRVVLDLTMVSSIDDVSRRMLLEVARRLTLDGSEVYWWIPRR